MSRPSSLAVFAALLAALAVQQAAAFKPRMPGQNLDPLVRHVMFHSPKRERLERLPGGRHEVQMDIVEPEANATVTTKRGLLHVRVKAFGLDVPSQGHFAVFFDNDTVIPLPSEGMQGSRGRGDILRATLSLMEVEPGEHRVILAAMLADGAFGLKGFNFTTVETDPTYVAPRRPLAPLYADPDRVLAEDWDPPEGHGIAGFTVGPREHKLRVNKRYRGGEGGGEGDGLDPGPAPGSTGEAGEGKDEL